MRRLVWLAVLCVALAGCAGGPGGSEPGAAPSPSGTPADPLRLIGSWRIDGVDEPGALLYLGDDGMSVWRRCGRVAGSWSADEHGLFAAHVFHATGCPLGEMNTPEWLARVAGYRVDGDGPVLLDLGGAVVVRLRAGGHATPVPQHMLPRLADPPTVTDRAREMFAPAAPLPAGLTPPSRDALIGRWELAHPRKPYVELRADGTWDGSDGCNLSRGRWAAGPGGALVAAASGTTLMACDGAPAPSWLSQARRAALDADTLVLLGADAAELGRLPRAR